MINKKLRIVVNSVLRGRIFMVGAGRTMKRASTESVIYYFLLQISFFSFKICISFLVPL